MEEISQAEFYIEVSAADATPEEPDPMTRQLLSELRDLDVEFEGSPEERLKLLEKMEEGTKKKK